MLCHDLACQTKNLKDFILNSTHAQQKKIAESLKDFIFNSTQWPIFHEYIGRDNGFPFYLYCVFFLLFQLPNILPYHHFTFKLYCGINHRRLKIEDRRKNRTTLA